MKCYFPKTAYVPTASLSWWGQPLFYALLYTLLLTALASPIRYDRLEASERNGRDLVLVLDTSGSMAESGFDAEHPDRSKYDALLSIADDFLKKRYDDNVGLVLFGTFAFAASPVTYDLRALREILKMTDVGVAGQNTAIGEGVDQALRILRYGHAKRKVIVLLTDGYQNAGAVSIAQAVEKAKKEGVVIYTIGIGKQGSYDAKLLTRIAKESGGKFFSASNAKVLADVFETLDRLEPSPIRSEAMLDRKPLFYLPLVLAMILWITQIAWRRQ